jgi:hypothetical protein
VSTGVLALLGVFAFAALCAAWNWRRGAATWRRVAQLGFERCQAEEAALERAWRELARARGPESDRFLRVSACWRRAAGWGWIHRFQVNEGCETPASADGPSVGSRYDAYLLDLREPERVARAPVTLYVLPPGNALLRRLIRATLELDPPGRALELGGHSWCDTILAAYAASEGKLDDLVPEDVQERLSRAAEAGFFCVHLGGGRAGFAVLPGHRDVDAEWHYLSAWS